MLARIEIVNIFLIFFFGSKKIRREKIRHWENSPRGKFIVTNSREPEKLGSLKSRREWGLRGSLGLWPAKEFGIFLVEDSQTPPPQKCPFSEIEQKKFLILHIKKFLDLENF